MNISGLFYGVSPGTFRRLIRLFPPIQRIGVRVDHISRDWQEWHIRLPLNIKTRNYVGTQWGGGIAAGADPWFMFAWMHILGKEYIVWDKAAAVRFLKPGRTTLRGNVIITDEQVAEVRRRIEVEPKFDLTFNFQWVDSNGVVVAEVDKTLHFRKKLGGDSGYAA